MVALASQVSSQNVGRVPVEVVAAAVVAPGGTGVTVASCVLHVLQRHAGGQRFAAGGAPSLDEASRRAAAAD